MIHNSSSPNLRRGDGKGTSQPSPLLPTTVRDVGQKQTKVAVVGIDLTNSPRWVQLVVCSAGVFIFYVGYGYMQELIFKLPGMKPFGWYLTLVQFAFYSCYGFAESKLYRHETRRIPMKTYWQLAFYTVATMGLSNASVGYLNYPTQVIFKCCKLIPVLIGGILIQGKKYGLIDFFAACLMSLGLIWFSLADSQVSPNFDTRGYVMITLALLADAIIGNVQEKAIKAHGASNNEVVLYSYSIGCGYILIGTLFSGELWEGFSFFFEHPVETYGYAFIFATLGYLGVNVVLTLVTSFGAFLAVTVTTLRKALTIIMSFVFFAKPFTFQYVWAGVIVLIGVYLNVYGKNKDKWNAQILQLIQRMIRFWQAIVVHRRSQTLAETV
uniref:Adenosine 3'-phospho 5'-phosphosulfate transporter 2 n=1 Tax=Plectus sambesii TaxID=2011161 RepID=A0A914VTP4_9BILA